MYKSWHILCKRKEAIMNEKGFTLIEIMMVVAILAILVAISIPQYKNFISKAKRTDAYLTLDAIHKAEISYFSENDQFAHGNSLQVLEKLGVVRSGTTSTGYMINNFTFGSNPTAAESYVVTLSHQKNFDHDIERDVVAIGYDHELGCPYGIPYIISDDILNVLYSCS